MSDLSLAYDLTFEELYDDKGLARLDVLFLDHLQSKDAELKSLLEKSRTTAQDLAPKEESDLILALVPHLESFLGTLFGIEDAVAALSKTYTDLETLFTCKRQFVQRRAAKAFSEEDAEEFNDAGLAALLAVNMDGKKDQVTFAKYVTEWLEDEEANAENIDMATRYAAWAATTQTGQMWHIDDALFQMPQKVDHMNLVYCKTTKGKGVNVLEHPFEDDLVHREGFNLTDPGMDSVGALGQANYCIFCHERGRDNCRKGMHDKKTGAFVKNPLGVVLEGCPLEEKISEMNRAMVNGNLIGALAIVTIDNPMVAGTGHRICNDCMKACIYQKQDPVDIPQAETRMLKDVLALPWGFEIYSLLTRWNPTNLRAPVAKPETGYKVLVVGAGPAGTTLSHFLLNEGHHVVCVDGLKVEPLDEDISGVDKSGGRVPFKPVHNIEDLYEPLDERSQAGFGGVAEYGITVRWDKNFLKVLRLLVERRARFSIHGGVRFGSAITDASAFEMGFDHIALCMGAGKPTFLSIPNGLARGVRQASDFLMALQLTGAAKKDSVANLQVRLPAVVIGGGLTAIDTATEVLAYYVRQVEKFLERYEALVLESDEETVRALWNEEEALIADEFLTHGRAIRLEREDAKIGDCEPYFYDLLNQWGGATIAYRRRMLDSPSYQLNHEEITKAFEQGMRFVELVAPTEIEVDDFHHVKAIHLERQEIGEDGRPKSTGDEVTLPARSVLIAAGTQPNTVLAREHPGFSELDGKYFQAVDEEGSLVTPEWSAKPEKVQVLMPPREDGRCMSFLGDLHPSYAGNVVKAMASAKQAFPVINRAMTKQPAAKTTAKALVESLNTDLRATVREVKRLTPTIIEVIVHAPLAAKTFKPGQFFRLQNFEANATRTKDTSLAMEGIALTGAWVDVDKGLVSLIVLEMGGSSSLCTLLKPGEPVVLMGPTGAPTETPSGETVLLLGGGLGNAVLFSIGQAMRKAGSKVLYFAAYKTVHDRYHIENIEAASDEVIWCCDEAPGFEATRPQDRTFVGNVIQAMLAYAKGELGDVKIPLSEADRIIAIGSDMMMNAVKEARHDALKEFLKPDHVAFGSINSPMQCMMKEICAQCLQPHKDPETGEESVVFSCFNQDQPLDRVVFPALRERLCQNAVHEKLTRQWITHCMAPASEENAPDQELDGQKQQ
jgi:NADPH-dependent glutamate synthase beta subunit-like oxidoreductase/NAD(P)H-flavin reductase